MNTRLLKKIKKRYVYFWQGKHLRVWDKREQEEMHEYMSTQYWMIRIACGFFIAEKYLGRRIHR